MKQSLLKMLWCLALCGVVHLGHAATMITTQGGNWFNDPMVWGGQVPGPGDDVLLTYPVTFNGLGGVYIVQDLDIGPNGSLGLSSGQLQV